MDNTIFTNMIKSNYNVIALMSGTSLDGIDLIYVSFYHNNQWEFKIHYCKTYSYDPIWKQNLSTLTQKSLKELGPIDDDYTQYLAKVISGFIFENSLENIDFIASHGHTALHQPDNGITYQIGNQQTLADLLRHKVICDFRVQDMELGGQGAPLVPIGDRLLFGDYDYCLNLGGFANISFENNEERIAYDICPVNIVLNRYVSKLNLEYDDRGTMASSGKVHQGLLNSLNELSFYDEMPPKSLGLEWVQKKIFPLIDSFDLGVGDILRTFVEHTAIQISTALQKKESQVLITGGGVFNDFLIERLTYYSDARIIIPSKEIIEFKEALVFGLLGVLKDRNEVNCLSSVTGASHDHSSGKILIPKINLN